MTLTCLRKILLLAERLRFHEDEKHERSTSTGWHTKGRFRPDRGWQTRAMAGQRPALAGWEIYHVKGSPVDPNRLYASQSSAWFGQIIQRSSDGGKTWETPGSSPEDL